MTVTLEDLYLPASYLESADPQISLSAAFDFDHVLLIEPLTPISPAILPNDGIPVFHVATRPQHAPFAPDVLDPDGNATTIEGYPDWELITGGLTGQHGYRGPWLHDSEVITGGVARRVLEHVTETGGGFYVAIYASYYPDFVDCPAGEDAHNGGDCGCDTTIEGWAIAYRAREVAA